MARRHESVDNTSLVETTTSEKTMKYKNLLLLTVIAFASLTEAFAVKARQGIVMFRQSDGSTITVEAHGDEHFHFYTATDGTILIMEGNSLFVAENTDDGSLASSGILAHAPGKRDQKETLAITRQDRRAMLDSGSRQMEAARAKMSTRSTSRPNKFPSKGSPKAIVLLVEFNDLKFRIPEPKTQFETYFNSMETVPRQVAYENYGSVKRYYSDMSFGQFTPQFDIYGPYTINKSYKTYGANDNSSLLVNDACSAADNDVDFSQYDSDNDGFVDLVYILYAGYGENFPGNSSDYIWPHTTSLSSPATKDGKQICLFGVSNELYGAESKQSSLGFKIEGAGVFCHEFAHCLGLPDIYPTGFSNNLMCCDVGLGYYGLMDSGEYTFNGFRATALNCWERSTLGWIEVEELTTPQDIRLTTLEKGGKAYMIKNEENPSEYYMIEQVDNNDRNLWNFYLFGNGMLIYHIDYDATAFSTGSFFANCVNTEVGHPRFSLVAADGLMVNDYWVGEIVEKTSNATINAINNELLNRYEGQTMDPSIYKSEAGGDPFPGTSGKTEFTDLTTPSAFWYTGGYAGKPLTDIRQDADGNVSFKFMGGATGIKHPLSSNPTSEYYTLDGKYAGTDLNSLPKGIYINRGKGIKVRNFK